MIEAGRRVSVLVGVLVAVVGVALAAILIFLGSATRLFASSAHLSACFSDVTGLRKGALVVVAGVSIGAVGDIKLDSRCGGGARVELDVDAARVERLPADTRARLVTMGLLGDRLVALIPGAASGHIAEGQVLRGEVPADASVVIEQASDAFEAFAHIARRLDDTLAATDVKGVVADVGAAARSLRRVADRAEKGPGLLHLLVYDRALERQVAGAGPAVARVGSIAAEAARAMAELERASRDVEQIVAYVRSGQGTLGGVIYDPAIYEDLRLIVGKVRRNVILRTLGRFVLKHE